MTIINDISKIIKKEYKEFKPDAGYINCVVDADSRWSFLSFQDEKRKRIGIGKFRIKEIVPVESSIAAFSTGVIMRGSPRNRQLVFDERTGLFRIEFSDDSILYVAKWFSGAGSRRIVETMIGTEIDTWKKFAKMTEGIRNSNIKPKIGIYRIYIDPNFKHLQYEKYTRIPNNKIFHDVLPTIKNSVSYYFDHVSDYMKYNQSGRRSLLLYGEPGTSKTSTLYQLAIEHSKTKSVVFATDIESLAQHIVRCEKYSIPTLAFFEDCESAFAYNDSSVKNFLSGSNAGKNKSGTCIVYTTNYPGKIEESIIERPERIDELHYIGPISGDQLIECAKFYFGEFCPSEYELRSILAKPMAGAEVKLFVENVLRYCASNQVGVNVNSMMDVLNNYREDIQTLKKFAKVGSHNLSKEIVEDRVGFKGSGGWSHNSAWKTVK